MDKKKLLGAIELYKKDIGPKENKILYKKDIISSLSKNVVPKIDEKGKLLDNVRDKLNKDLANPSKEIKFESTWKPKGTTTKEITHRILVEAELENRKPNAFRLNIQPIVLDVTHAKLQATRHGNKAVIEILFPNANDKITLKVQVKGAEDRINEIGLEDPEYMNSFGAYIINVIDEMVLESGENVKTQTDDYIYGSGVTTQQTAPNADLGSGSFSPNWEAMRESDSTRMKNLMALMEQENDEEETDPVEDDAGDADLINKVAGVDPSSEDASSTDSSGFSEGDFAIDAGADTSAGDFSSDFGGGFGGSSDFGGEEKKSGGVNSDGEVSVESDVKYMTFRDKTDWLNSSLDTMQKLTSSAIANKMQDGSGVIMTSDEILNGTVGIKGDTNYDVIDKFLKIYPELDSIDLTDEQLEQIDEKLSLDDGQFDPWLQQQLPEFTGASEVDETLNNEMFDNFDEMGGEQPEEQQIVPEGDITELSELAMDSEEEVKTPEEIEAEIEVGGSDFNELPNIFEKEPKKEEEVK
jgi:hypothetical protein